MKGTYTTKITNVYSEDDLNELAGQIEKLGLSYKEAELGGGPAELAREVVVWANLHPHATAFMSGVAGNMVWDILKKAYSWTTERKPKKKVIPGANISLYIGDNNQSITLTFNLNEPPTKEEVRNAVGNAYKDLSESQETG